MRFLLIGRGKMGRLIQETAQAAGDEIEAAFGRDDLDQLGKLGRYVDRLLHEIAREIRQGNIDADPCCRSEEDTACQFCDWADACHFQDGRDGDHLRYILPVKAEEFWAGLEDEDSWQS